MTDRVHHEECAQQIDDHSGPCFNRSGDKLPRARPVTDELLTNAKVFNMPSEVPWGYSKTGIPMQALGILLQRRPAEFFVDGDGMPGNPETEEWFKEVASLKPLIVGEALEAVTLKGETAEKEWRPEGPTVEVRYRDETGLEIDMSMTITDEIKPYYDADMALNVLASRLARTMHDVSYARVRHERDVPTDD